jgi:hypothetical protein
MFDPAISGEIKQSHGRQTQPTVSGASNMTAVYPISRSRFWGRFGAGIASLLIALLLLSTTVYAQIIPANRATTWQPGVTYNGGIPNRTTIYQTLSPSGGDDTAAIQAALNGCPPNQVVLLTAGVFKISGNGLSLSSPNCTLRGAGPGQGLNTGKNGVATTDTAGTFVVDPTATQLIKIDRTTNLNYHVLAIGNDPTQFSTSINLAADAAQGTNSLTLVSNPGIQVGEIVLIDMNTDNDPDVVWGPVHDPAGGGSRRWFVRQDRSLNQMMEVTAVNGNTITFATPFHITFKTTYSAQLSRYAQPVLRGIGVEDIFFYGGMGGDWHGNVSMNLCAYCWIKHVEAFWSVGTNIGLYGSYRSELRDSYIHETPDANPGGAGYQVGLNYGASDNLVENNIMWYGNKQIVMRGTGGGNVVAYNYMDDSFGTTYPESPEAGLNAGHYTTPHMELLEGNYSQNFKGDSYWGNSIYITVFRNWLSSLRAAHAPLNTYTFTSGNCNYRYGDYSGRAAVDLQAYSYYTNFVGNVLGSQNQQLLGYNSNSCFDSTQVGFNYETLSGFDQTNLVDQWKMGSYQATVVSTGNWSWVATTYQTQLRQGNWDWSTKTQSWDGIGGTGSGGGPALTIPNSLYLSSAPAFFGSNTWPWVDPTTGATYTLPAKARFEAGTPNQVQNTTQSNNNTVAVSASPSNGGTAAGGGTIASGSPATVTATANSGYTFTNWTENGTVVSTAASYTFTPAANRNLVANFTQNQSKYTVAVSASPSNGGTAAGGGTIASGSPATVTATANSGYTFKNWTEGGTAVSTAASYTFTPTANRNLVANFTANAANYSVSVSASPSNGGTVASGGTTFASGSSDTVTATANSGYTFKNWTEGGAAVSAAATYTFTVTANRNLVANFTANPVNYSVSVSASPSNGGAVGGGGTFASGSPDTVTATANSGFTFANWTENGTVVSTPASYPFTVTANRNLVANFTANPVSTTNPVNLTVVTNPSPGTGGTTSGGGTFPPGTSRTVTAAANSGYVFNNWTADGTVVSTAPSYSFILKANRALVANFKRRAVWPPALPPGWTRR